MHSVSVFFDIKKMLLLGEEMLISAELMGCVK